MSSLGGEIVGYGIGRKDGTVDYKWLEQPKHNRITQQGMNLLFMLDEDPTKTTNYVKSENHYPALWTDMRDENNTGVLEYCAYGNGQGNTSFYDTDLHNRTSDYVNTKYTGVPYCGSNYDEDGNNIIYHYRVSHKFPEVEQNTTIREIGYYSKILVHPETGNEKYIMFSRVLLAEPITIEKGEYIIFTYQMNETVNLKKYKTYTAEQFNADSTVYEFYPQYTNNSTGYNKLFNRPCIDYNGNTPVFTDSKYFKTGFIPPFFTKSKITNGIGFNYYVARNAWDSAGFARKDDFSYIKKNEDILVSEIDTWARKKTVEEKEISNFEFRPYEMNSYKRKILFKFQYDASNGDFYYFYRGCCYLGAFRTRATGYIFETSYDTEDTIAIKQGTFVD